MESRQESSGKVISISERPSWHPQPFLSSASNSSFFFFYIFPILYNLLFLDENKKEVCLDRVCRI